MNKFIALSGWKRSGKDTVADHLVKKHRYTRISFADILKDMCAVEYKVPRSWFDDPVYKEAPITFLPPVRNTDAFSKEIHELLAEQFKQDDRGYSYWTPRALAILKGSTNRAVDPDYWVKRSVALYASQPGNYVISDMRYRSEFRRLTELLGNNLTTVRIERFDTIETSDPSERDLDDTPHDVVIQNRSSINDLLGMVDMLIA